MANRKELSVKQVKALAALLTHGTYDAAARVAGVSRHVLSEWANEDPLFRSKLREAADRMLADATLTLKVAANEAIAVLREVMADKETATQTRIMAAGKILDLAFSARLAVDASADAAGFDGIDMVRRPADVAAAETQDGPPAV